MSDIVERLLLLAAVDNCQASIEAADTITRLRADIISYKIGNKDLQDHCTELTNLTAEVEQNAIDLEEYRRDVERLRSVTVVQETLIREAEAESEKLRAALERIADTDPDEGTQWFHEVARAALSGDKQ